MMEEKSESKRVSIFTDRYKAKLSGKQAWKNLFTKYALNSQFMRCEHCEAKNCPYRNQTMIEGGDKVCAIEQGDFYNMRKQYTRDYLLTASDLIALDIMLFSIIRIKRIQRYLAEKQMDAAVPHFNPKTGETIYTKQMREINKWLDKSERNIREWMHSNQFARKERNKSKKKKDYALELMQ